MTSDALYHALGLHLHQPPGNLRLLLDVNPWEAEQILRCYERIARYALAYRDVARLHVGFSGVLLEQLLDHRIVDDYRHIVDIPRMIEQYREADNIELVGMGYYHPIFPLIPRTDWCEQLERGRAILEQTFGRAPRGFWPSELVFSVEMIPALVQAGYDYVVVDGVHVRPEDGITDIFRPYLCCYEGVCIRIVPRDRDLSTAQRTGLEPDWFGREARARTDSSPRPHEQRLITTWSDGENGDWFRQPCEASGFFGRFFAPYMEALRRGECALRPIGLSEYLRLAPPTAQAQVQTGGWNAGSSSGLDLSRWAGSARQRETMREVQRLSDHYWRLRATLGADARLASARRLVLEAETSCFLFWGDAWLPHLYARLGPAADTLEHLELALTHPEPGCCANSGSGSGSGAEQGSVTATPNQGAGQP